MSSSAVALPLPATVDDVIAGLAQRNYLCDRRLATALFLSLKLQRPLFLEGEPGVGKTELAKALSDWLGSLLLRVQCYEGLDIAQTAYEWNVARQMIEIRLAEAAHGATEAIDHDGLVATLYSRAMLIERPLLQALTQSRSPVLLIDELDRADEPFDAFLLEVLAENQITVPELGTIKAVAPPFVLITSNRTREIHDALKRRCLYHWVEFPDVERELEIVRRKAPGASERLSRQIVEFVQRMRTLDLFKAPGVAETIDWTNALVALNTIRLDPA
ncbi:MAG: MoxR family ATPase, partial [Betaproteobacteria bacterium]|nr:MoxR family ATPase [Betaproteobacteria bacterium]